MLIFRVSASTRARPRRGSRLAWLGSFTALSVVALGITGVTPALASTPTKPHTPWSYYITSTDTATAYTLGCNQGKSDTKSGQSTVAFLDFGGQISGGTELINGTDITNAQVESISEQFAAGYEACLGSSDTTTLLTVAVGTNNSIDVGTSEGETWAGVVNTVTNWTNANTGQATAMGGDDIEPGFGSESDAIDWAKGFSDDSSNLFLNYGSADGCEETTYSNSACNNGWDEYDVWYVAWGNSAAVMAPEIYYSVQAEQWEMVCLYGVHSESSDGAVEYWGPLDENDLDSSTLTSTQAWDDLENDLNANSSCAQTMPYSLEVHDE
jgi:hypothetical protein